MPVKAVGWWERLFNYVFRPKISSNDLLFLSAIVVLFVMLPSITYLLLSIITLLFSIYDLNLIGSLISFMMLLISAVFTRWSFVLFEIVRGKAKILK